MSLNLKNFRYHMEARLWTLFSQKSQKHRDFLKKINKIPYTKGIDPMLSTNIDIDTKLTQEEWDSLLSEFEKLFNS